MKKITLFLLLFSVASLIMTTGCGSDDTTTTPTNNNQDSTPTVTTENQIQIGLELFKLNEETDRTFGEYDTRDTSTYISVFGNDKNEQVVISSRLDNLGKGASGAAIQCMNLVLGYDEFLGL